jgi:hypothetical protein
VAPPVKFRFNEYERQSRADHSPRNRLPGS